MVARLRPAAAAAYERLRELSAVVPLSEAERASLRRAANAVSGLSDAVTVIERYLDDGPQGEPGALEPAFKRAFAEWEAAFHRKGVKLTLSGSGMPAASFDGPDLKLLLDQLLRRAFDLLPVKARLDVTLEKAAGGIEAHFTDDQPLSGSKAAQAFDPGPDLRSLALPMARRMMRRWGGEARMEKTSSGTARLVLYFAVPA
jgi:signal transduction histidine kinase